MIRSTRAKHKTAAAATAPPRHQKTKKQPLQAHDSNGQDRTKRKRVTIAHLLQDSTGAAPEHDKHNDGVVSQNVQDTSQDTTAHLSSSSSSSLPLPMTDVCDLPIRVFIGTYTGILYGLETIDTIRQMNSTHNKTQTIITQADTSQEHTTESEDEEEEEDQPGVEEDNHPSDHKNNDHRSVAVSTSTSSSSSSSSSSSVPVPTFLTLFCTDAHRSAIHALAASQDGHWLISSGPDEIIQLYSLSTLQHHGSLHRHHSTITGLVFATPAVFCSSSEDGSIGVWSAVHRWEMIASLRAHTAAVISMSIHASAKVMLTVSKDQTVRLWDLVNGTLATTRHLSAEDTRVTEGGHGHIYSHPLLISWCHADPSQPADPHHLHYCLLHDYSLDLYNEQGLLYRKILNTSSSAHKMTTCCFFEHIVLIGYDHGHLSVYRVNDGMEFLTITEYHHARIRCMEIIQRRATSKADNIDGEEDQEQLLTFVCTADTQGQIHLWNVTKLLRVVARGEGEGEKPAASLPAGVLVPVASAKSEERITALTMIHRWEADVPPPPILTLTPDTSSIQTDGHTDHHTSRAIDQSATLRAKTSSKQTNNPNKAQRKKQKRMLAEVQQSHPQQHQKTRSSQPDVGKRKSAVSSSRPQSSVVIVNKKRRVQH